MKPKPKKPRPRLTPEQKEKLKLYRQLYLQNNPEKVKEWAERAKFRREYQTIF